MANPFSSDEMAAGYAKSRPPVHPLILQRALTALGRTQPFPNALDVGCGSGVSTRALEGLAENTLGIDPAEAMLPWAAQTAPRARFQVAAAETLPVADHSVELITAAGSLNYADLDRFFPEAARALTAAGVILVYDFSAGRSFVGDSFVGDSTLDTWFSTFETRYTWPPYEAQCLNPEILAARAKGFQLGTHETFEIPVTLTREFYVEYMLTETNVAAAIRQGTPLSEIREWVRTTLSEFWTGPAREIIFRGYYACLLPLQAKP
jgi:SAM-dependent methyltransferase